MKFLVLGLGSMGKRRIRCLKYLGYENKSMVFGVVIDYSDIGVWPNVKLAIEQISNGNIPLWNPHQGIGAPLGADSTLHIFSPYNLGFFLPPSLWDIPILIGLWVVLMRMHCITFYQRYVIFII